MVTYAGHADIISLNIHFCVQLVSCDLQVTDYKITTILRIINFILTASLVADPIVTDCAVRKGIIIIMEVRWGLDQAITLYGCYNSRRRDNLRRG